MSNNSAISVFSSSIITMPRHQSVAGNITALNNGLDLPFKVRRVYYTYDIPGGESRGGHAHIELHELIIAASGSFDVLVDDGKTKRTFHLARPYMGLYLPPGLWRELVSFSSGSICLVLASDIFLESDYIRDYPEFKKFKL